VTQRRTSAGLRRPFITEELPTASAALARLEREQRSLRLLLEAVARGSDLRDVLTRIVHTACDLMVADHGTIALVDAVSGVIRIEAIHEMPPNELGAEFAKGEGLVGEVWRRRRSVILGRYADLAQPRREVYAQHAVLGVPIRWGREVVGVFGVGRSKERPGHGVPSFGPRDIKRLETFARYASLAIHIARTAQNERQRAARLALISRVGRLITADLRVDDLLQTAADALHELLGYPNIAIPLLDRGPPEVLVVGTVGGFYKNVVRGEFRLPLTTGIMGAAARTRRIVLVNDVTTDPRYFPTPNSTGIYAELAVPILLGEECLGVLNVESGKALSQEDAEYLRIVADQLAVAIENARLHATARELAVVEERHHLARELHDSVTQLIFSSTLIAESIAPVWRRDPDEGERRAQRLLDLNRLALGEMRALLTELRSAEAATSRLRPQHDAARELEPLREHGLREAIRRHAHAALGDSCRIVVSGDRFRPMPAAQENAMYRIAQEALFNVAKHARAGRVSITVSSTKKQATLRIADDGTGIRPARRKNGGGHGLVFMRERAEQLGGRFSISAGRTRGTVIEVVLPLDRRRQG
jgi:signal transduction histidine kinase